MTNIKAKFFDKLTPYWGVIYFVALLLFANMLWKLSVHGDDSDTFVSLWGFDVSAPFDFMAAHVALVSNSILQSLSYPIKLEANNVLRFDNNVAVRIVWSCTALKQAYIFFCILAFYNGPLLKKLWFIPLGLFLVYVFNIFRISMIVLLIQNHPERFDFLHLYVFKYLFYAMIFGLWVVWEEKIRVKGGEKGGGKG